MNINYVQYVFCLFLSKNANFFFVLIRCMNSILICFFLGGVELPLTPTFSISCKRCLQEIRIYEVFIYLMGSLAVCVCEYSESSGKTSYCAKRVIRQSELLRKEKLL